MSACIPAKIFIGGVLPANCVQALCEAICADGPGIDWGGDPVHPKTREDLLALVDRHSHWLELRDSNARNGFFESIEFECLGARLSWDRHSEGRYELTAEWVRHRPDVGEFSFAANDDGDETMHAEPVYTAYAALLEGQIHQALTLLADVCRDHRKIAPLPPFTIEEGDVPRKIRKRS